MLSKFLCFAGGAMFGLVVSCLCIATRSTGEESGTK